MSDREGTPPGEAEANPDLLNVKVTDGNNEVFFKIKRKTKLGKLMNAFCHRQGKNVKDTRFMFDGERVKEDSTPDSLGKFSRVQLHLESDRGHPVSMKHIWNFS